MFHLALRNLTQNKARLVIAVAGVGLALTLVFFIGAVFTGAEGRLTAYIDHAGADVWVSQAGVRTMHMSASVLPASVVDEVKSVPGVAQAVPILYADAMIQAKGNEYLAYVFGLPPNAPFGGPSCVVAGRATPEPGEVILDRAIASQAGLRAGDQVIVLGQTMRVAGLTAGTASIASSVSFITMADFARLHGQGQVVSFVLVKTAPGASPADVADQIGRQVSGVAVQTRQQFATQERKLVMDMSGDTITIMNTAGFITGLAVLALTIYIATIARRKEYGVLKAIGTRNRRLYEIVVIQALLCAGMGLAAGLGLTLLLAAIIPRFNEVLALSVSAASVLRVFLISIVLAGVAALLPARQLAGLEPATVVRRG